MSINTEAQKYIYNATSTIRNGIGTAETILEGIVGRVQASFDGFLNGDVVGIIEEEIPNMTKAIDDYCIAVENHLKEVNAKADTSEAYKGAYASSVKEFVGAVTDACFAVTSNLKAFKKELQDVLASYKAKDQELSSTLGTQAGEVSAQFKKYEE